MTSLKNSKNLKNSREEIQKLSGFIGVYIFTKKGKPQYIGKSINVKARLLSHIENARIDAKERLIIANSDSIEYIDTDSEFKALLLESKLIQTHRPRYNVRWRDDKSYLYIRIPVKDEYPIIKLARREREAGVRYFGPFPSTKSVEELLRHIRKIFPFCTQKRITSSPCFYAKIGLCDPCPSMINSLPDNTLKKKFKSIYKKNIREIIRILEGKTEIVQKHLYSLVKKYSAEEDYESALEVRNKIQRFEKLMYQRLFDENDPNDYNQSQAAIKELQELIKKFVPDIKQLSRLECFDISNLSFKEATASMVVMINGQIRKDQYRKFRIKNLMLKSDFEMIAEVIMRRFKNKWDEPDLLVIDGGKPQVRVVMTVLAQLSKKIFVMGIAKNPDRLVLGLDGLPTVRPSLHSKGFSLIRHLRDESHRFAKKYHTLLRKKKLLSLQVDIMNQ